MGKATACPSFGDWTGFDGHALLCPSYDLSPALIAEYQTQLPDKKLLQAKLQEFYALNIGAGEQP